MDAHLKLISSLREEPFFCNMTPAVVASIEEYVYFRAYEPRQVIYFPENNCDHVYWVHEGRVKITRTASDGRELTFRHLFSGDMFGEECLIETGKRRSYAEALVKTILYLIRADDFRRLAREESELGLMLAKSLCHRTMEIEQVLATTVFSSVRSRLAWGLMRLYRRAPKAEDGSLRVTHQELASLIGATRETTTSVLHGLREDGIIVMANRSVTILDAVALEQIAKGV